MTKRKIKGCRLNSFIKSAEANGGQAIFYILKCHQDNEVFYKLGITVNHLLVRYSNPKAMPYNWNILVEYAGTPEDTWKLELKYKEQLQHLHYTPTLPFSGSITECYTALNEEILQFIEINNSTTTI